MKRAVFLISTVLLAASAWATPTEVLAPQEGYRVGRGGAWVVVRGGGTPDVFVDGKKVDRAPVKKEGVHHLRVYDFKRDGSKVEIRQQGRQPQTRTVFGGAPPATGVDPSGFHATGFGPCAQCHEAKPATCAGCHRRPDHPHRKPFSSRCTECHEKPGAFSADVSRFCADCHKAYAGGRHPRLKHVVEGENDPLRNGHRLDCASCHEPHAPKRLGDMTKDALRNWCKRCHAK